MYKYRNEMLPVFFNELFTCNIDIHNYAKKQISCTKMQISCYAKICSLPRGNPIKLDYSAAYLAS